MKVRQKDKVRIEFRSVEELSKAPLLTPEKDPRLEKTITLVNPLTNLATGYLDLDGAKVVREWLDAIEKRERG